jgi:hypothetical protein
MPLAKGLILTTYFTVTCGILAAINAYLLREIVGFSSGTMSVATALGFAVIESLVLLALGVWIVRPVNRPAASGSDMQGKVVPRSQEDRAQSR